MPTTLIYTLSLHDALPILGESRAQMRGASLADGRLRRRMDRARRRPFVSGRCDQRGSLLRPYDAARNSHSRSEEHTSELQSQFHLVCRLLLEKKIGTYDKT